MSDSFPMLGKFLAIISWNIFSVSFLSLFFFWHPIKWMLVRLTLSQNSLRLSSFLFSLLSLFCFASVISTILSSASLIHSSASCILLLAASSAFFISVIVFCISSCLSFISCTLWSVFPVSYPSLPPVYFQCLASSSASTL